MNNVKPGLKFLYDGPTASVRIKFLDLVKNCVFVKETN